MANTAKMPMTISYTGKRYKKKVPPSIPAPRLLEQRGTGPKFWDRHNGSDICTQIGIRVGISVEGDSVKSLK